MSDRPDTCPDCGRLVAHNEALREQLARQQKIHASLLEELEKLDARGREFAERYLEIEHLNSNLANLYVTSYRLHTSLGRREVLRTIEDIVVNLIGSEEFAIVERARDGERLVVASAFGADPERVRDLDFADGVMGDMLSRGAAYVAPESAAAVVACVPLVASERVVGAIVIFRLLPHKARLESIDHELFNLLATHAGSALYCSALQAHAENGARS